MKVYLPRHREELNEDVSAAAAAALTYGAAEEVVLVVEEGHAVREMPVAMLSELGCRVMEADSAAAALPLLDNHPEIALLFTDVVMPKVNGHKLADEALKRRPGLKVLFATGYTRNVVVKNGVLDASAQLIGKPFTMEKLATCMRAALEAPA